MYNKHCDNSLFLRAVDGISINDKSTYKDLYKKLEEVAKTGTPTEFQHNYFRIRYNTRDKFHKFCLYWEVANAISGRKRIIYQKDYVSEKGSVRWKRLASDIRRV
jgi:hypothetical protein